MRIVYSCVLYFLTPFFLLHLLRRAIQAPAYLRRWGERFAFYTGKSEPAGIWVHAVSVGEAEAAFPLIHALRARYPSTRLLVTTTTPTGSARISAVLGEAVEHVYLPYDLPDCIGRFLRTFQPKLAIVMETEIWPNLFYQCHGDGVPVLLVNARLSDKSARRYRLLSSLVRSTLACVTCIGAQTQQSARRFLALGADPTSINVTGNIKFDQPVPASLMEEAASLRASLFQERPVWIAASTHSGEDDPMLDAYRAVKTQIPTVLLVLVPRHPERFDAVASLCRKQGLSVVLRSEQKACGPATDIFLVNTMGELKRFYGASDAAFVGGSLVSVGGHNVLEPAALGVPVFFGPFMFNFDQIARSLKDVGAAVQIADPKELARRLVEVLRSDARRRSMGDKGRLFVQNNRGALGKTLNLIERNWSPC